MAQQLKGPLGGTQIVWSGNPGSHQGKVSVLYSANTDSALVPVLNLWPLEKVSDHNKAYFHLPRARRHPRFVKDVLQLEQVLVACHQEFLLIWAIHSSQELLIAVECTTTESTG